MKPSRFFAFAFLILTAAGGAVWYIISDYYSRQDKAKKAANTEMVMYKNPGCQCCDRWADYMQDNGFTVSVNEAPNLPAIKAEHSIPQEMGACHTAFVGGYVIEGHVPADDVKKLLRERPKAAGLVVPGMPASSPGMNTAPNEPYKVYLFKNKEEVALFSSH